MAKKSAAAKKRARERKKANNTSPEPPTNESSSSSEAGTEPADTQAEHNSASNVVSTLGSLQVNTGELTSDVLQSAVSHSARLPEGEPARIVSEKPLFTLATNATQISDIQGPFERLSAENKTRFLQLADAHLPGSSPTRSIFLTNRIDLADSAAVFLTTSRLNYSCLPNTDYAFNVLNGETTVHAFKDIRKGEEVLISYAHPYRTALQRKEQELKYYNFDGDCMACASPNGVWERGDKRRSKMFEFDEEIAMWETEAAARSSNRNFHPTAVIEGLIELLEEEGLTHGALSQTYADAAKWSRKLGRRVQATAWTEQ